MSKLGKKGQFYNELSNSIGQRDLPVTMDSSHCHLLQVSVSLELIQFKSHLFQIYFLPRGDFSFSNGLPKVLALTGTGILTRVLVVYLNSGKFLKSAGSFVRCFYKFKFLAEHLVLTGMVAYLASKVSAIKNLQEIVSLTFTFLTLGRIDQFHSDFKDDAIGRKPN